MSFSLNCWCVIISLLLQTRGGLAHLCYVCNTRDHERCDDIRFGENNTYIRSCIDPCAIVKGQWGLPGASRYMLWRGCNFTERCTQANALCCYCVHDYCNYDNTCYSRGNLRVPGLVIFLLNFKFLVMVY